MVSGFCDGQGELRLLSPDPRWAGSIRLASPRAVRERLRKFYFADVNVTDGLTTPRFLFVRGIVLILLTYLLLID